MSTGGKMSNQSSMPKAEGANLVGKPPSAVLPTVPPVLGTSGQGDNQSVNRGKGKV